MPTGERSSCTVMALGEITATQTEPPDTSMAEMVAVGDRPGGCTGRQTMPPSWVDHTRVGLTA